MKKIGIITIHNCKSFGACLQTYALYRHIKNVGYECEVIDLRRKEQSDFIKSRKYKPYYKDESVIVTIKRFIKKRLFPTTMEKDLSARNFKRFNDLVKLSTTYRKIDELYNTPPIYDIYVTGSDQVWNPYQPYCIEPYFLTFAPRGKRKISFAASIGVVQLEKKVLKDYKKWLSDYNSISVREAEAKKLLQPLTDKHIDVVSDPTFLLDVSSWKSLCETVNVSQPYILLFSLSFRHELLNFVLKFHKGCKMPLVILGANQPDISQDNVIQIRDAGPYEFLSYINNAEIVFTDSFHGTVFSLILGVKYFYTYISKDNKRGSRIVELLSRFNLNDHLLDIDNSEGFDHLLNLSVDRKYVLGVISKIQIHDKHILQKMMQ